MRRRAGWLGVMVAIGPLIGSALAQTTRIGEVAPKFEFKDIRYLRRTLPDLGNDHFEWQLAYECRNRLPAGTKIEAIAHFDNSKFNVYNPDPDRTVPYGAQTYDEMFNGFVFWTNDEETLKLNVDPKTGHVVTEPAAKH
jgi:hypothetical protein